MASTQSRYRGLNMNENEMVKYLKEHFNENDNAVLKFVDYSKDNTNIVVKGTVEEWKKFIGEPV